MSENPHFSAFKKCHKISNYVKYFFKMKKAKTYLKPIMMVYKMQTESSFLTFSAGTTNPVEGGDPTGGNGETPNPFGSSPWG